MYSFVFAFSATFVSKWLRTGNEQGPRRLVVLWLQIFTDQKWTERLDIVAAGDTRRGSTQKCFYPF